MDTYFIVAIVLPTAVFSLDPCTNNKVINDAFRSVDNLVNVTGYEHLNCDRKLQTNWYRIIQGNTHAQLPTHCIPLYHCGTHVPLWMNRSPPSVADGIVVRQICGKFDTDCCNFKSTTRVKNCGSFFVYELKPTLGCSMAYCSDLGTGTVITG